MLDVDALAAEIRRVDGSNSLGAGALAEALMPFIQMAILEKFEGAFSAEIDQVSHLEYDANSICRHFYTNLKERMLEDA